jgi:hypothetical protein
MHTIVGFHKTRYAARSCSRNIEMTPLCKVDATLREVRGASGVRDAGGVDEQEGIRPARSLVGRALWPSARGGRLRVARSEAAPGVSFAGRFEASASSRPRRAGWIRLMRAASTPSPRTYSSRSSSASRLVGAGALGLDRGYSAHSMRATFITTALENGAQLEDVQKAAGHRDPSTTKLYDRRGYNPEKAASFFATY